MNRRRFLHSLLAGVAALLSAIESRASHLWPGLAPSEPTKAASDVVLRRCGVDWVVDSGNPDAPEGTVVLVDGEPRIDDTATNSGQHLAIGAADILAY